MASLCRPSAALFALTPRWAASASFSHSAVLSAATLSAAEQSDGLVIPEIFDIFDAPVRLGESSNIFRPSMTVARASNARVVTQASGSISRSIYSEALESSWTLPPPVIFDGPARPPHLSPFALEKRRLLRQNLAHSSRKSPGTRSSAPLYEVFDGPSRITRYKYPSSAHEGSSYIYAGLVLCISSAFGWLAFRDTLDSHCQSDNGFA
ncbi:hypothetical protein BU15DRAFT_62185 [Melanogaster broomeanus]|nr:hypothetical protein BU15DRAFT_62185 [Melanogaster broomeanus]